MRLRGVHNISLDAKGRLVVPTRFKALLQAHCDGALVITIDTEESCLLIYPAHEWDEIQTKIEQLSSFDKGARRLQRLLIGHATDVDMDGNGRVLIPAALREYAGLDKKMVLLGQGKKFELWDEQTWLETREEYLQQSGQIELTEQLKAISL